MATSIVYPVLMGPMIVLLGLLIRICINILTLMFSRMSFPIKIKGFDRSEQYNVNGVNRKTEAHALCLLPISFLWG